jgi:peroxiredoxin
MLKSREGQKVPNVTFSIRVNDEWQKVSSDALFTDIRHNLNYFWSNPA